MLPKTAKPVWWDAVTVNGDPVSDPGEESLPASSVDEKAEKALLAWVDEGPISAALQDALRNGKGLDQTVESKEWTRDPETGEYSEQVKLSANLGELAEGLRHAISQGELTQDAELWRGIAFWPEDADELFPVGGVVSDPGFMSVAMSPDHAEAMVGVRIADDRRAGQPWLVRVLAPAGTHVAPGAAAVSELILAEHTKMRVISREPPGEDEYKPGLIVVELVD